MLANVFDITSCFRLSLPCGGRRDVFASRLNVWRFQSTPSVGRATKESDSGNPLRWNFNPRPPWGGRQQASRGDCYHRAISIHALRGEDDHTAKTMREIFFGISIHALRGEDDLSVLVTFNKRWYFNPRPPWGGRP